MARKDGKKGPQTSNELAAKRDVIRDMSLDKRTKAAQRIEDSCDALAARPRDAVRALLRRNLAITTMLQDSVLKEFERDGKAIGGDKRVDKLLRDDLLAIQASMRADISLLAKLEGIYPPRDASAQTMRMIQGRDDNDPAEVILAMTKEGK